MSSLESWPRQVFESPVLRGLDARGRETVVGAGRIRELGDGEVIYRSGDPADAFFVVAAGEVEVMGRRRGDADDTRLRLARRGDSFGEEAVLPGGTRRAEARALGEALVAEVPAHVLDRAATREGTQNYSREERALRRLATRDLLATLAFTRGLSPSDLDLVLDAADYRVVRRGERLYVVGDPADAFYLLVDGLVQLQSESDETIRVTAYLSRGDFFGDEELGTGARLRTAAALGECAVISLPMAVLRTLSDRNPELLPGLRRISAERQASQVKLVGAAAARTTQHVFQDLYRMQMARALLAIDQDTCVRCGHCAWACEQTHGVSRLVRRGDKIITPLVAEVDQPKSLLLPNSCQHCKNPVCMIDCPTGAIGRDPAGEVFIREDLCTGCTACAKACPWDNIRMAPRGASGGLAARLAAQGAKSDASKRQLDLVKIYPEVAVKCDLCRGFEEPACVAVCPTESIFRLEPTEDIQAIQELFGAGAAGRGGRRRVDFAWALLPAAAGLSLVLGALLLRALSVSGSSTSGLGVLGSIVAALAGLGCFALAAYVVPKRRISLWMKRKASTPAREAARLLEGAEGAVGEVSPRARRSRVRPFYLAHVAGGCVVLALVVAHTGLRLGHGVTLWLSLCFWTLAGLGLFGAFAQRLIPSRLARLERAGLLPEDFPAEKHRLLDRVYREISGRSELVKKVAERLLLPYARSRLFGPLSLVLSGRSLSQEQARLNAKIDALLEGRGGEKRAGLPELVKSVVEVRALPARRALTWLLRVWHAPHALLTLLLLALVVLHALSAWR